MKITVLQKFRDKNTKEIHKPGQVLEVTKKRFEEMNSTSFGVLAEEIKEPEKITETAEEIKESKKPAKK